LSRDFRVIYDVTGNAKIWRKVPTLQISIAYVVLVTSDYDRIVASWSIRFTILCLTSKVADKNRKWVIT